MAKNKFHIGKLIETELRRNGMPVAKFAKEISLSRNVVYNIFDRASINTHLLFKISEVLKYDFFEEYSRQLPF